MQPLSPALAALHDDSLHGRSLIESSALGAGITDDDAATARSRIAAQPGHEWYHALFALRRGHPAIYAAIAPASRAHVMCDALAHLVFYNDWGYLDPAGSHDGEAAKALLELGDAAASCLRPLLADRNAAPLFGSEEATLSSLYKYRRCDFAYRYLIKLRGGEPAFDRDPAQRDRAIAAEGAATGP
jgi:hypothetical protein